MYSRKPAYFERILYITWDYFGFTGKIETLELYTIALALLATTACAMALYRSWGMSGPNRLDPESTEGLRFTRLS